jgi:hypothetical protein
VDLCLEHETLCVHQDVALTPFDLLASVVTSIFCAYRGGLDRPRIHHASTRLWISLQTNPQAFADGPVDLLPGTVYAPFSEIVVDGGPSREVVRKHSRHWHPLLRT